MSLEHVKAIFTEAAAMASADDRAAYLGRTCAGDPGLRRQVEALLAAQDEVGTFLETPALGEAPPEASAVIGARIGPYKILEQIGEGGFGIVYMAEQEMPVRRKVALKLIKPGMDTKQVIARFEAERQALALMDHPNIAKVLDAGETSAQSQIENPHIPAGLPYFVMELVNGIPITRFCQREGLTTLARLELFIPVCQAVQHAHQKGIIHRDLKPSNVLVTMIDGRPVPKVIDFGVAKAIDQRLTERTLWTHYGQMIGTPAYMSPEQAELSGQDVDTRSDIYSLGCLLYELLTGTAPIDEATLRTAGLDEIRRLIRETDPPKPSTRLARIISGGVKSWFKFVTFRVSGR
jgi:eukaryotic-like serine/threonine-protein kinase